jgi:hypothetical protein
MTDCIIAAGLAACGDHDLLVGPDGRLTFDGYWTDLRLRPPDQEEPVGGGISHATLSDEECAFIFGLCVAGHLLIVNPQGAPTFVVPQDNHIADDIPKGFCETTAWVNSPVELREALTGSSEGFLRFKEHILNTAPRPDGRAPDSA